MRESKAEGARRERISGPILALDTTGALGSVALGWTDADSGVTGEVVRTFEPSNRHARRLLPAIRGVLGEANLASVQVVLLVATRGPGSFTGLRIGLATAQGFALAAGVPAVGVSSLDAAALADANFEGRGSHRRLVLVDALRGELFAAVYEGEGVGCGVSGPRLLLPEDAGRWAEEWGVRRICGPGVGRYRDRIAGGAPGLEIAESRWPLAPSALRLGLEAANAGESTLEPLYLRDPDIHGGKASRSVTL